MEKLYHVSYKDKPLGFANYDDVYKKKICHRVVHLFLFNGEKLILQKRSSHCKYMPGCWSSSCQGHVRYGESYAKAAKRECEEELNMVVAPKLEFKFFYKSDICKIIGVCVAHIKKETFIKTNDVTTIKSIHISKIDMFLKNKRVHPEFLFLIKNINLKTMSR